MSCNFVSACEAPEGHRLWFLASEAGTTEPMPYGLAQRIAEE